MKELQSRLYNIVKPNGTGILNWMGKDKKRKANLMLPCGTILVVDTYPTTLGTVPTPVNRYDQQTAQDHVGLD